MQAILRAAKQAEATGVPARLATIVAVEGSTFRSPGARLLITPTGTVGTVSGGCLEAELAERALAMPTNALPALWRYDTRQEDEALLGWGSGCGGAITVLVEDLAQANPTLDFIADCHAAGAMGVVASVLASSDPAIARPGDWLHVGRDIVGTIPSGDLHRQIVADARRALKSRQWKSAVYTIGSAEVRVLIEPIIPPVRLLICGIGEEAMSLARIGKQLGWHVTLADPRLDPSAPTSDADRVLECRPGELLESLAMPGEFAAVIMTHRLLEDVKLLGTLLPSRARYIGVLGPKRRLQLLLERLPNQSLPPAQRAKIHGPAGLDIGAETPEEIALSIAAEITASFADRPGGKLRHRRGGIHARGLAPAALLNPDAFSAKTRSGQRRRGSLSPR